MERIFLMAWMAGVLSASAAEPLSSCEDRTPQRAQLTLPTGSSVAAALPRKHFLNCGTP